VSKNDDDNITELRPGQKAKVKEPKEVRPPAETPRTWDAPEVRAIADLLRSGRLPHMSALRGLKIVYVFSNAEREADPNNVAKAQRYNATYSYHYEGSVTPEFILRVSKPQWDRIPDDLRAQAVYHYLLWLGTDTAGRPRIEKPDVVAFSAEIEQWKGAPKWNEGLKRAQQLGLFDGVASAELIEAGRR
jgi:hypothetical protein